MPALASRTEATVPRRARLMLIVTSTALALALSGCARPAEEPAAPPAQTTSAPAAPTTAVTQTQPATSSAPTTAAPGITATSTPAERPAASKPVSSASRRYAKGLGGVSRLGETLYFIVGGSFKNEAAAAKALKNARPYFGDMQDYFIVQRSDNFSGMRPGSWVLIEGHRSAASAQQQTEFAQRAFTSAVVRQAAVNTSDPIPVYEDLVDSALP